jgi:hypothetical protein
VVFFAVRIVYGFAASAAFWRDTWQACAAGQLALPIAAW